MATDDPQDVTPEYDVCLSFATEQRPYVEQVADILRSHGVKVFYDSFEQATLWGKDLYEHLDEIYRKSSRYCVVFASADYARKIWTNHERRSAQARAIIQNQEYILPARFDNTDIPGIRSTVAYIDLQRTTPAKLARLIIEKLGSSANVSDKETGKEVSIASTVTSARRSLMKPDRAFEIHDMIRQHADRLSSLPYVANTNFQVADERAEYEIRLSSIEAAIQPLVALVATSAYWGNEETDRWWFGDIARFAQMPRAGGLTSLINLTVAPATYLLYTAGVGAACAGRWLLVGKLLSEPSAIDTYSGKNRTVAALYPASRTLSSSRGSLRVYNYLRPFFVDYLKLGEEVFREGWERFAYLLSITNTDAINAGHRLAGSIDTAHIRANDTARGEYQPVPSDWLNDQMERQGPNHPLLLSGLCGGQLDRLRAAQTSYDQRFASIAHEAAWRALPRNPAGFGGCLPSGMWYPDEAAPRRG